MFDVGFFELLLIGVVALLVVGPERLPRVAKTAGMWIGRGRRFVTSVKQDIEQEIRAEELKKVMDEQKASSALHEIIDDDTRQSLESIKKESQSVTDAMNDASDSMRSGKHDG